MQGTIKKLTDKGYGFIQKDNGKDLFFHCTSVENQGFDQLYEGQSVEFVEEAGDKGPRAGQVTPVN